LYFQSSFSYSWNDAPLGAAGRYIIAIIIAGTKVIVIIKKGLANNILSSLEWKVISEEVLKGHYQELVNTKFHWKYTKLIIISK